MLFAIPSAKSVPGINQIVKKNSLETAERKYALVWVVGVGGDEKLAWRKLEFYKYPHFWEIFARRGNVAILREAVGKYKHRRLYPQLV